MVSFNNYYSKSRIVTTFHDYVKSNLITILFVYLWLFEITVCNSALNTTPLPRPPVSVSFSLVILQFFHCRDNLTGFFVALL